MPNAVKLWKTALRQLQQLPAHFQQTGCDASGVLPGTSHRQLLPSIVEFDGCPSISSSVWKQLVNELKVPLHLSQAVASAADLISPKACAALWSLAVLWEKAAADGVLVMRNPHASAGSSLQQSFGQQLQQSGLMAALPRLLEAAAAALKATQHEPALAHLPQHSNFHVWHTWTAANAQYTTGAVRVLRIQLVTGQLLQLLTACLHFWPQLSNTAAAVLPGLRACTAVLQHCSRCADLISPDAPAPIVLEELVLIACSAVHNVCTAWEQQSQPLQYAAKAALAVSVGHPEALQAICMLLLAATLRPQSSISGAAVAAGSGRASSTIRNVSLNTPAGVSASQAAWQYACTHQAELTQLQQQVLHMLGCTSSRALMHAAQHALGSVMNSSTVSVTSRACMQLAQHWSPLPQLDQPQQLQQLAEALAQLKEGSSPPCGSRLLPCAALLWLMPAVLLEWAQKQPAEGPSAGMYHFLFSGLWGISLGLVVVHQQFWARAHWACDMAMRKAARQQGPQGIATSSMLEAASKIAAGFSKACQPPASHLVQLLRQASSTAAQMMASAQDGLPTHGASSGSSTSHSGTMDASGSNPASSSSRAGSAAGRTADRAGGLGQQPQSGTLCRALYNLSTALQGLHNLVSDSLWANTHNLDVYHASSSSVAVAEAGPGPEQQASLASLCAAWQQTLPQLNSLTEAALRREDDIEPHSILQHGSSMAHGLCNPGLFVAAGLQPGSPALQPQPGLAVTLLKLASAILAQPEPNQQAAVAAIGGLGAVMGLNVMVLCTACVGCNSDAGSSSDAVISMLSQVESCEGEWGVGALKMISSSGNTSQPPSDSSGADAVALVPWLVSLGRCCMLYNTVLQKTHTSAAISCQAIAQSSHKIMGKMAQALQEVAAVLPAWLQSDSVSAQLAAAGYSTQRVIELLQSTVQAGQDAVQAGAAAVPPELVHELGLALCNLPMGTACNNHRCVVLAGLSEQQLVVGKARVCAGCRVARYCCRACQVAAWKQHRPACKAVACALAAKAAEHAA